MPISKSKVAVTFGSVTVLTTRPSASQVQKNIVEGQQALQRARKAIVTPGIKLEHKKDVPLYFGCEDDSRSMIREMNGIRERGRWVDDHFEAERT